MTPELRFRVIASEMHSPGFSKMAARYWKIGLEETHRSLSKSALVRSLQRLIPEVREQDFCDGGSGVRAQAVNLKGALVDDFCFVHGERMLHVGNVPSPAATASLMIGKRIVQMAAKQLDTKLATSPIAPTALLF